MEECIDRFMLRLGNGDGDAKRSFPKKAARRLKTLFTRHGIGTQIKELKARVAEEGERRQRLNLDNYVPATPVVIDPRLAAFHGVDKELVAIDGPRDQIISWLTQESLELRVVAIVGGGGLGKTTLAMEVYRKTGGHFQCQASVSVSHALDLGKLLKDILSQIDQKAFAKCKLETWDESQIIRQVQRVLTGKRYFLVIDDVWKEQDWGYIKAIFHDNDNGSRIIVTTRITKVAKSCCFSSGDHLYQMSPLNDVDSQRLFFKRIFHSDNSCPPHLEKVSARILRKCGGMPLAIITIASLLANKSQNLDEWERIQNSIGNGYSYESDDDGNVMRHILLLSYWDLPHHLKTCLLYLCIYPEDKNILCEELKWKWIAEGFIATQHGNFYQVAENYFNELVNRSLIQLVDFGAVADDGWNFSIHDFEQYCQVHDMVLDLIISMSDEENFATVINGVCNSLPTKIRRLSLQSSWLGQNGAIHAITTSRFHLRSLHMFGKKIKEIPPLMDFPSLRVFDICRPSLWEDDLTRNIGSWPQLRYLRIQHFGITVLPEDIGKLQNLATLDLRGSRISKLPSTIARLQKLVRLFVDRDTVLSANMLGSMRALEEVSDICQVDNPERFCEELRHLTKFRKISMSELWIWCGDFECYRERLGSSLNELGKYNLRYLQIHQRIGEYMLRDPCCTFPHLQHLKLWWSINRVPKGMASLTNILKLQIEVRQFDEEGLHILMGLPSLAYLQLKVRESAGFVTVSNDGFKLLEVFHYIIYLDNKATGIEFAAGAMPALRRLQLYWSVYWMSRYSDGASMGVEHLSSLAHLHVETNCCHAILEEVEALEGFVEKAISLHPNRHTLQLRLFRRNEDKMFRSDEVRQEELKWRRATGGNFFHR